MSDDHQGEVEMNEGFVRDAQNDGFCVVFDGPPGPESCRFVEVETLGGRSVRYGEWGQRDDGYWTLTFPAALRPSAGAGEDEDEIALRMMHILHEHLPEEDRPMGWSHFSDEQAARVRKAALYVLSLAHSAASGSEWRPISDLPPDGDLIIAWGPHAKIKGGAYMIWEPSRLHAHRAGKHPSHLTYFATHFRNLPPPPTKKEPETNV